MDYANYQSVPEKVRQAMRHTGTLIGRDGVDVTIRFESEGYEVEGTRVTLLNCILRMVLIVTWPDAVEQTVARTVHHPEFTTVRYLATERPITHETEEATEKRQIAEARDAPEN